MPAKGSSVVTAPAQGISGFQKKNLTVLVPSDGIFCLYLQQATVPSNRMFRWLLCARRNLSKCTWLKIAQSSRRNIPSLGTKAVVFDSFDGTPHPTKILGRVWICIDFLYFSQALWVGFWDTEVDRWTMTLTFIVADSWRLVEGVVPRKEQTLFQPIKLSCNSEINKFCMGGQWPWPSLLQIDEGWWKGSCHGKSGLFPANYVELQK